MNLSSLFNSKSALRARDVMAPFLPTGMAYRGRSLLDKTRPFAPPYPVTRAQLARTAPFCHDGQKPLIWAYSGSDEATRGDTHGTRGIARRVATLLDGRVMHVDAAMLRENFADTQDISRRVARLAARDGQPDIIMGTKILGEVPRTVLDSATLRLSQVNEELSSLTRLRKAPLEMFNNLVAHHLTPEILAAAGEEFRIRYPAAEEGTLLAVQCAGLGACDVGTLAQKIVASMAHESTGTVFVCPCHRTVESMQDLLLSCLDEALAARGLQDRVKVETVRFAALRYDRNAYNPYVGLLARADHIIVAGSSHSLVSEALAVGKRVFLFGDHKASDYMPPYLRGHLRNFEKWPAARKLESPPQPAYDVTGQIAAGIARAYDRLARLRTLAVPVNCP